VDELLAQDVCVPAVLSELAQDVEGHCCIEPSGEADTTDLPVGSSRHVSDGATRAAQVVTKETRCGD
jgi:hypothetical protein